MAREATGVRIPLVQHARFVDSRMNIHSDPSLHDRPEHLKPPNVSQIYLQLFIGIVVDLESRESEHCVVMLHVPLPQP